MADRALVGPHDEGEHGAIDQDTADHGEILAAGRALNLAADMSRALGVAHHEEHPRQHQQRGAQAEGGAVSGEAGRLRGRDDAAEGQALVRGGEGRPGLRDLVAAEQQQASNQQDAEPGDREQPLLDAPVRPGAVDQQRGEAERQDRAEQDDPPLCGDPDDGVLG